MAERVLFIRGIADSDQALREQIYMERKVRELQKAGALVTVLGDAHKGFSVADVPDAVKKSRKANTVIVEVHGSIKKDKHYLVGNAHTPLWAEHFYNALTDGAEGRPLNVFMMSCGSGNGCEAAAHLLPLGSTFINFVKSGDVSTYGVKSESFTITPHADFSFPENLFLSMLCRGLHKTREDAKVQENEPIIYQPQLTVSAENSTLGRTHELWNMVRTECSNHAYKNFVPEAAARIGDRLRKILPAEKLSAALATFDLIGKGSQRLPPALMSRDTPVTIPYMISEQALLDDVHAHDLLGPLCAVAYVLHRKELGAFQSAEPDFYHRPGPGSGVKGAALTS